MICEGCGKDIAWAWISVEFHWVDGDKQKGFDDYTMKSYCGQCEILRREELPYAMTWLFQSSLGSAKNE